MDSKVYKYLILSLIIFGNDLNVFADDNTIPKKNADEVSGLKKGTISSDSPSPSGSDRKKMDSADKDALDDQNSMKIEEETQNEEKLIDDPRMSDDSQIDPELDLKDMDPDLENQQDHIDHLDSMEHSAAHGSSSDHDDLDSLNHEAANLPHNNDHLDSMRASANVTSPSPKKLDAPQAKINESSDFDMNNQQDEGQMRDEEADLERMMNDDSSSMDISDLHNNNPSDDEAAEKAELDDKMLSNDEGNPEQSLEQESDGFDEEKEDTSGF